MKPAVSLAAFVLASAPLLALAQEPLPPPEPVAPAPAAEPAPAPAPPPPVVVAPQPSPPMTMPRPQPVTYETPAPLPPGPASLEYIRIGIGPRFSYVRSDGFDLFAKNDLLTSFALDATVTLFRRGNLTLAAGLAWDVGSRSDGVRGIDSSLTAHRFTVPIEGRFHYKPWLYSFAKVAPGAAMMRATFDDGSNPALHDTAWAFAADLSVGGSVLLFPHGSADKRELRVWLTPEIGYSLATSANLRPDPGRDANDVLGSDAQARLGSLGLSGLFWRVTAAATF